MKLENIMTKNPVSVSLDDSLGDVKEIFDNVSFHHLLVVENDKLIAIVSDRDLLRSISPNIGTNRYTVTDLATLNKRVHQIATRHPVTLCPENTVLDAAKIFNTHRISCIPVVDFENKPVGIISWRDIMKHLESLVANTEN